MSIRWLGVALLCETFVALLTAWLLLSVGGLPSQTALILVFLPAAVFGVHVFEEFAWPGGYPDWANIYRPDRATEQTHAHLWRVNLIGGAAAYLVAFAAFDYAGGYSWLGVRAWLALLFTLTENAGYHIGGTIRTRRYSPVSSHLCCSICR